MSRSTWRVKGHQCRFGTARVLEPKLGTQKTSIQHQIGVIAMRARFTHFEVRGPLVLSASKFSFF